MLLLFLFLMRLCSAEQHQDLVEDLPGLTFKPNFKTYAGYLKGNEEDTTQLFYALTESETDPDNDPLVMWMNGGPGITSLGGLFREVGPFRVNQEHQLERNIYSWNTRANLLVIESPSGTGFSYDVNGTEDCGNNSDDDKVARQNYAALNDFFARKHSRFAKRRFVITGQSYAGFYIPTLAKLIMKGIDDGTFPNSNFEGIAIGNGKYDSKYQQNSQVIWGVYHGRVSHFDWERMKTVCRTGNESDAEYYDYTQYLTSMNGGLRWKTIEEAKDQKTKECARLMEPLIKLDPRGDNRKYYNYYHDCYDLGHSANEFSKDTQQSGGEGFNYLSTDSHGGWNCWADDAINKYLNKKDVQAALHVAPEWQRLKNGTHQWTRFNNAIFTTYNATYTSMQPFFDYMIQNAQKSFRILFYSGDADIVCNFIGDQWFIRDVAQQNKLEVHANGPWHFANQVVGFRQHFDTKNDRGSNIDIDVLTVKGAGHLVPSDRPGPAHQMINNFLFPSPGEPVDYSKML